MFCEAKWETICRQLPCYFKIKEKNQVAYLNLLVLSHSPHPQIFLLNYNLLFMPLVSLQDPIGNLQLNSLQEMFNLSTTSPYRSVPFMRSVWNCSHISSSREKTLPNIKSQEKLRWCVFTMANLPLIMFSSLLRLGKAQAKFKAHF